MFVRVVSLTVVFVALFFLAAQSAKAQTAQPKAKAAAQKAEVPDMLIPKSFVVPPQKGATNNGQPAPKIGRAKSTTTADRNSTASVVWVAPGGSNKRKRNE